jgi:hypothetical protein
LLWRLREGSRELALDVLEVHSVPTFSQLAINKSASGVDVEANLPPRRSYTHNLRHMGSADIEVCFDDVVSIKVYSVDENMFIGNNERRACNGWQVDAAIV